MKPPTILSGSVFAALLGIIPAALCLAAPQSAHAQNNPCLVYNSRSTTTSSGYLSGAYNGTGILVIGPAFADTVANGPNGEVSVEVTKRNIRDHSLYTNSQTKKKYYYTYGSTYGSEARIVGAFNTAKKGSANPSISVAVAYGYLTSLLSDTDVIGKATWRSPYKGADPMWLPASMTSSFKQYDLNPDRDWNNPQAAYNYFGQTTSGALPCTIISGKTTYTHNSKLSEMVKGMSFEDACTAVVNWLKSSGYEEQPAS